jgi:hypothetical protein
MSTSARRKTPDRTEPARTPLEQRLEGLADGSHAAAPQLGFLLAGAQWRDSWLHGFRSLYLVMEVILLGLAGRRLIENRVPALIAVLWISWMVAGVGALYLRASHLIG